ncbi:MAG: hypothetical protein TU35_001720 [Thermoproteus sp. AZ2]|uniref:Uncharacterized protein n=1 Tax=Thermoproteus sp. AZ2 TaxID=1609232 RepID=A0ACC6UZE1_9CREN|nr:MAG: hypothetical protein TU35_00645 [Thermoproteus sp. AZ2]
MDLALYAKRRRALEFARAAAELNLPYVLDVSDEAFDKSPYIHAVELEQDLPFPPAALVFPKAPPEGLYKYIYIADLLGVEAIVLPPPNGLEELAKLYDEARQYDIYIQWAYGEPPLAKPSDVEAIAEKIRPRAAKIAYDVVKAKSMHEILHDIVRMQGYIATIYLSNKRGSRSPRLPPFDPSGAINYVDVVQAVLLLRWDGRYVFRVSPQYLGGLKAQISIFNEVVETFRNTGKASKKVQRMLARVFDEIFAESGITEDKSNP